MPPKPVADLVEPCLGKAVAAQGFAGADLLLAWPEIAGERLGRFSRPIKVEWPRRRPDLGRDAPPEPATLVLRVEGAFALEAQHLAPVLIERVNAVYGWRCIGRIVLKQGPVRRRSAPDAATARPLTPEERARLDAAVAPVETAPLRDALARLGAAVVGTAVPRAEADAPLPRSGRPVSPTGPSRSSP